MKAVSVRLSEDTVDAFDDLADAQNTTVSEIIRQYLEYGLETAPTDLGVVVEVTRERNKIIDQGRPIDLAGGFAGRVRDDFEKRFLSDYEPKWLAAKAQTYYREAEVLEETLKDHPDAPEIEDGEFVEKVDEVLSETIEASQLSDWEDRYGNRFEKFEGVETGREKRRFALVLTKNAMKMDKDIEPLRSEIATERRVEASDLSELADEDLPPDVDREDVARVARELRDKGLDPEDIETDPTEFDPFGWSDLSESQIDSDSSDSESQIEQSDGPVPVESSTDGELPAPDETTTTDGGMVADGGGDESIVSYVGGVETVEPDEMDGSVAPNTLSDDDEKDAADLVEWTAEKLRDAVDVDLSAYKDWKAEEKRRKKLRTAKELIRTTVEEADSWQADTMTQYDLSPESLLEAAETYNDARDAAIRGQREMPEVVASNGGVRIE